MVPFIGSGIKVLWAGGGISKSTAISSITGTLINIIGGGQATNIRNIVCFALGKAGNYNIGMIQFDYHRFSYCILSWWNAAKVGCICR